MSPVSCKGRAELWQHTGAQTCQGHSVNKAQRVEGRNKPFLSPVQRAPLCLSNVTEFVSLKAPSSPSESDPEPTATTAARTLRLCRQEVTPAAPEEAGTYRGTRGGRPPWPHPLTQGVTSCLLSEQSGKAAPETRREFTGASLSLICGDVSGQNDTTLSAYRLLMYILRALAHGALCLQAL